MKILVTETEKNDGHPNKVVNFSASGDYDGIIPK